MTASPTQPRRPLRLLAALAVLVLVLHAVVIEWMARQATWSAGLKEMPEPLFTRVLEPTDPAPVIGLPPPPPPPAPVAQSAVVAAMPQAAASAPVPAASAASAVSAASAASAPEEVGVAPPPAVPSTPAPIAAAPDTQVPGPVAQTQAEPQPGPAAAGATATAAGTAPVPAATSIGTPPGGPGTAPGIAGPPVAAATPATDAASAPGDPFAATWPADSRVTYKLTGQFRGGPLYGSAKVQWLRQGAQYQARVELSVVPFGSAFFTSQGQVTPQGLVPQAFEEARGSRRRVTRFNEREVVLHDGRSLPRPEGVQDMASQFIELGWRFRTGVTPTTQGTTLTLPLVRPGGLDTWTYDVSTRETLRTDRMGELEVVRVAPRPYQGRRGTLASEIWFAPRLQYLPVRFKVAFGEEAAVDLVVESVEQR